MSANEKRRAKLTDIAAKTGYTVGTISKALQNREGISPKTRENIIRAAREVGYIANAQAGGLRSGSSKTVAIIVSDIANPLFAIEIKQCVQALEANGYRAIVMDTEERADREEQAIISALSKNVDGVLVCPTQKSKESIQLLQKNGMPFVLLGRRFQDLDADYIVCDDEKGGYLAGKHLAELGHRRILLITADPCISSSLERLRGFERAMRECGIEIDPRLILQSDATGQEAGCMVCRAMDDGLNFTAVFSFSDYIAWEIIYSLNQRGVRIPQDLSVMGFDDVQSHMRFPPPLTTVHFPKRMISNLSVELLLRRIRGDAGDTVHTVLDTYLVPRETTAAPCERGTGC